MGEKGVVRDVLVLALAHHDAGRVVEHALDQHPAGGGHDDRRRRVLAHRHGQAADVVQMAMGDDDEDEAVPLAGGATTDAKLFRSPSTNSYWLQVGGEMKEVPEELLSIASNTSIPSKARAAKIMSKMEAMKTSPEMEPEF